MRFFDRLEFVHELTTAAPRGPIGAAMRFFDRREFVQSSTALAAAFAALGASARPARAVDKDKTNNNGSANDRLRVAVVGVNGRGGEHIHALAGQRNCVVTTICDPDVGVIGPTMSHCLAKQGFMPRYEADIRKVLE